MDILLTIFNNLIFQPIVNLLVIFIDILPGANLGVAIILVTVLIRLALFPLSYKALKSQKELSTLQPKIKEIQKKHKKDKEAQSRAIMEFYKEHKINPFSGCVPFLIQLPIILGMYRVFLTELEPGNIEGLYSFVSQPEYINTMFLSINLAEQSLILAILAGLAQFVLSKTTFSQKKKIGKTKSGSQPDFQKIMGKQMTYILPFITIFIARSFPAGLVLYWFTTTVFSFGQQYSINKKFED
ncbi:MAG: YidC/Oxa1 family membrane protein insertase [Candidatus Spechtbacterales bacterium]|nr:YidC/Oxa1 family membrane protein insertase [Candidatus Spechtbacterales bacterium]